jgi:hypothetical protein
MQPSSQKELMQQATISEQIVNTEQYIAHARETIGLMRSRLAQSENTLSLTVDNNDLMTIMLRVLNTFEEHHQLLLDLQKRGQECIPYWIPATVIDIIGSVQGSSETSPRNP